MVVEEQIGRLGNKLAAFPNWAVNVAIGSNYTDVTESASWGYKPWWKIGRVAPS